MFDQAIAIETLGVLQQFMINLDYDYNLGRVTMSMKSVLLRLRGHIPNCDNACNPENRNVYIIYVLSYRFHLCHIHFISGNMLHQAFAMDTSGATTIHDKMGL